MTDANDEPTDPLADDAQPADRPTDTTAESGPATPDGDVAEPGPSADATSPAETEAEDGFIGPGLERKLKGAGAVVLGLIATWATFQVYFSLSSAVEIWFSDDFVPVFQAAFNLIVVLVAVAGIVWLVRELS